MAAKEVSENIRKIIKLFTQEEYGNRLSKFSMSALEQAVFFELDKLEKEVKVEEFNKD